MKREIYFCMMMAILLCLTWGCSKRQTPVDMFYGTSYHIAKELQLNNPVAGIADGPSTGLDGEVGSHVIERYNKGFEKPAPKTDTFSVSFDGMKVK